MAVSFGMTLNATILRGEDDLNKYLDTIRMADAAGVKLIGASDTAFVGIDVTVKATLMATAAKRASVGPRPTNPIMREPQVMAAFLGGLDGLTQGRAFMNIASGDSAVYNVGLKPATLARLEDYVKCVRDLMRTGNGSYQGRPQRIRWEAALVRPAVPVYICAEGPKMLHLGGRIGDGVMPGNGLTPEVIKDTIASIHDGARAAGRKPEDVEIWFSTRPGLHEDRQKGIDMVKGSVASALNHSSRFGIDGKHVPEELLKKLQRYVDGYDLYDHARGRNVQRMDSMGLTDYALKRYAIAGNPSDWIKRIEELADMGATNIWHSTMGSESLDVQMYCTRLFCEKVMPHFA